MASLLMMNRPFMHLGGIPGMLPGLPPGMPPMYPPLIAPPQFFARNPFLASPGNKYVFNSGKIDHKKGWLNVPKILGYTPRTIIIP